MKSTFEQEVKQSDRFQFTVCTPTYNRAYTLHRVYESLKAQTYRDFEWLIVDDGSTDNTRELVEQWQQIANFPILYIYQKNAGKHVACNHAVRLAKGELFLCFDSDNICMPNTLERFKYHWDSISEDEKYQFVGVTALCMDKQGRVLGNPFPVDAIDSNEIEMQVKCGLAGEKWGFHRIDVLKEFPFPEIPGEKFLAEGLVWNRISTKYKTKYVNEKLQVVEYLTDGLTVSSVEIRAKSPKGATLYYQEYACLNVPLANKIRNMINYIRFSFHAGIKPQKVILESKGRFLVVLVMPIGYWFYKKDVIQSIAKV